jgi:hypothetical protein
MVCIHTENQNQGSFYPFVLLEISVLNELPLGHLRYLLTDVPPQPNSPPDNVFNQDHAYARAPVPAAGLLLESSAPQPRAAIIGTCNSRMCAAQTAQFFLIK